jgi:hypothetical protein
VVVTLQGIHIEEHLGRTVDFRLAVAIVINDARKRHALRDLAHAPAAGQRQDRALSRLLKGDWPRTLEELEEKKGRREP